MEKNHAGKNRGTKGPGQEKNFLRIGGFHRSFGAKEECLGFVVGQIHLDTSVAYYRVLYRP